VICIFGFMSGVCVRCCRFFGENFSSNNKLITWSQSSTVYVERRRYVSICTSFQPPAPDSSLHQNSNRRVRKNEERSPTDDTLASRTFASTSIYYYVASLVENSTHIPVKEKKRMKRTRRHQIDGLSTSHNNAVKSWRKRQIASR
jgi:hypothetical protein